VKNNKKATCVQRNKLKVCSFLRIDSRKREKKRLGGFGSL